MRKQVNVGKRIVRYFFITAAVGLSISFPSAAEMGSDSSQSVTVHELVTCYDRMISTLMEEPSDRYLNLLAQNICYHNCECSLIKFTVAEIKISPEVSDAFAISINIEETFKEVVGASSGKDKDNVKLSAILNLPETIIQFENRNQRDEFIANLREEEALRLAFSSADDRVYDFLAIKARVVPYPVITVTPLKETL